MNTTKNFAVKTLMLTVLVAAGIFAAFHAPFNKQQALGLLSIVYGFQVIFYLQFYQNRVDKLMKENDDQRRQIAGLKDALDHWSREQQAEEFNQRKKALNPTDNESDSQHENPAMES